MFFKLLLGFSLHEKLKYGASSQFRKWEDDDDEEGGGDDDDDDFVVVLDDI